MDINNSIHENEQVSGDFAINDKISIMKKIIFVLAVAFALAIIINSVIVSINTTKVTVIGESMEPTLKSGERITIKVFSTEDKLGKLPINRGDIVVGNAPEEFNSILIKRVAAIPGDVVEYVDGCLFINGVYQSSPDKNMTKDKAMELYEEHRGEFVSDSLLTGVGETNKINLDKLTTIRPVELKDNEFWIVSDNLGIETVDSRTFGPVYGYLLVGKMNNNSNLFGIFNKK